MTRDELIELFDVWLDKWRLDNVVFGPRDSKVWLRWVNMVLGGLRPRTTQQETRKHAGAGMANSPQGRRRDQGMVDVLGFRASLHLDHVVIQAPSRWVMQTLQALISPSMSGVNNATTGKILRRKWESCGSVVMIPGREQELPFPAQDSQLESSVSSSLPPSFPLGDELTLE